MTEFGVATNLGSVCFSTCFIPAAAHLVNYGIASPKPETTEIEKQHLIKLQSIFMRDMTFVIVGLILFYHFLEVGAITQSNLVVFFVLFIIYCYTFWRS